MNGEKLITQLMDLVWIAKAAIEVLRQGDTKEAMHQLDELRACMKEIEYERSR